MTKIYLKKKKDESVRRFHPWVFSGAVEKMVGQPEEGDIVEVYSHEAEFLAYGHYQIGSITVRILGFADDRPIDFWDQRLLAAYNMRRALGLTECSGENATNAYRLVHGEGDGLPGLIIDFYNGTAVIQAHSVGMYRSRNKIAEALQRLYGDRLKAVYDKSSGTAPFKAIEHLQDGYLFGDESNSAAEVLENGNKFIVNWEEGQKTGFFLDQRENRALVARYAKGRRVLNLFCYTGGFSIYALKAGAESVVSVDSSAKAMEMVDRNVELNFGPTERHTSLCTDAIEYMKQAEKGKYDLIVVDPPAFAKHRGALDTALRAYRRLNAAAIEKVAPGGFVFTYSCSQVVDRNAFALAVFSAAASTGRKVRILQRLMQPADHPVNIYHPEGEYLKGLLLYVE